MITIISLKRVKTDCLLGLHQICQHNLSKISGHSLLCQYNARLKSERYFLIEQSAHIKPLAQC